RIEDAIDRSHLALLLVSQDFLDSKFIRTVELPRIEMRAALHGLVVIPIQIGYCNWQQEQFIANRLFLSGERHPLIHYVQQVAEWDRLKNKISNQICAQVDSLRTGSAGRPESRSSGSTAVDIGYGSDLPEAFREAVSRSEGRGEQIGIPLGIVEKVADRGEIQ